MAQQPTGTVTMLFTDIEGSTRLLERLGRERYAEALDLHRRLLRVAFEAHGGYEVDYEGDAFFVAFAAAEDAVAAAAGAQQALAAAEWPEGQEIRVRMGVHTGEPLSVPPKYVGLDVHRAARIVAAGHGGQVLLSQTTRDLVGEGVGVRDLGEHRLKDLSLPQRLYQLQIDDLRSAFPALKTLESAPTNLPVQPTALIGREKELAEVEALLRRREVRLVTLTGTGGTGKTRLALQSAAALVEEFPSGVFFVSLAPVSDPDLVLPTVAQILGVREQAGEALAETLRLYLRDKVLLLVLDNFEQVAAAARELSLLLSAAPQLRLLTTSRTPLHLSGERIYEVPPLRLPDPAGAPGTDSLMQYEAVALFVERAAAAKTGFALTEENASAIAEICVRLDGLPLALELAAARVRVLAPRALLGRLDQAMRLLIGGAQDLDERQRTLRATIDWSHDLLAPEEKALFMRLGVFVGGCRVEAAEAVVDPDGELGLGLLDGLSSLVEKSLLRQREDSDGEPRFWMLETIREYARERLRLSGSSAEVSARHAGYFLEVAERADPHLRARDQQQWIDGLASEQGNLRSALAWGLEEVELEVSLRLAAALALFWEARGQFHEARRWLQDVIDASRGLTTASRARVLFSAGRLAVFQAEWGRAAGLLDEAAAAARDTGDEATLALALGKAAWAAHERGALAEGLRLGAEALTLARELDDPWISAEVLNDDACMRHRGDPEQARRSLEESLAIRRTLGDQPNVADSLNNLGYTALLTGDYEEAEALLEEGLTLARQIGDIRHIALLVGNLALVSLFQDQPERARPLFAECIRLCEGIGDKRSCLEAVVGMAALAATEEKLSKAACLTGAVTAIHQSLGGTPSAGEVRIEEQCLANARRQDDAAWARASAEGQKMTLDQAIALALEEGASVPVLKGARSEQDRVRP
jgi:predicted ATPase/class 3 adenylate cyclase